MSPGVKPALASTRRGKKRGFTPHGLDVSRSKFAGVTCASQAALCEAVGQVLEKTGVAIGVENSAAPETMKWRLVNMFAFISFVTVVLRVEARQYRNLSTIYTY